MKGTPTTSGSKILAGYNSPYDATIAARRDQVVKRMWTGLKSLVGKNGVEWVGGRGRLDGPGFTNSWIRKYIFPGGYSPALSEIVPVIERSGLLITDIEVLRYHYADTLRAWRRRSPPHRFRPG